MLLKKQINTQFRKITKSFQQCYCFITSFTHTHTHTHTQDQQYIKYIQKKIISVQKGIIEKNLNPSKEYSLFVRQTWHPLGVIF